MRERRLGLLVVVAALLISGSYLYANLTGSSGAEPVEPANLPDVATQIAFWETRVASQPGVTAYSHLASAHLRSARMSGDISAYQRAEASLDAALAINPDFPTARFLMASVRFALHDFQGALELAEGLAAERRPPEGTTGLLGDIYLALGDYDQARAAFEAEHARAPGPATLSRLAILADIDGDPEQAVQLMREASDAALAGGEPVENRAWYEYQVGFLLLKSGNPEDALERFERSDELWPGYYLARAGSARALAAKGDIEKAVAAYEELVAAVPQPEYLAALGDLYRLQGDGEAAREQFETVEFIAELGAGAYDRQFTRFLLDHDLRLADALVFAQRDVEQRQDIYAYDTLAWALYKNGRYAEAAVAAETAMSRGTRDAVLYYHAGMIRLALDDEEGARTMLETALELDATFDPMQAGIARDTLQTLD
jgi:tetratricopeptide (TPR) repeat protein